MHNISQSMSGELPQARRRCASEGKQRKSKPRPVSAVLYPMSRGRSGTEPGSSLSPYRPSSDRNVSLSESPGNKQQTSVLNRLMPRRKSRDGKGDVIYFILLVICLKHPFVFKRPFIYVGRCTDLEGYDSVIIIRK